MKRKNDFHQLTFINPFDPKNVNTMVCKEWSDQKVLAQWRKDNSKFLKDPSLLDVLDIDELVLQWNTNPKERVVNPDTCIMLFKELCMVLRLVDAEHQDALLTDNKLPGVVYSDQSNKYMYIKYDLDATDPRKGTKVELFDDEKTAYESYRRNRDSMIDSVATKALMNKLIDGNIYMNYFSNNKICTRDYDYYNNLKAQ